MSALSNSRIRCGLLVVHGDFKTWAPQVGEGDALLTFLSRLCLLSKTQIMGTELR